MGVWGPDGIYDFDAVHGPFETKQEAIDDYNRKAPDPVERDSQIAASDR